MTSAEAQVGAPPADRKGIFRLGALLLAAAGPAVLAIVGFDVPLAVGIICILASLLLDRVGPASQVQRAGVVLGAGAACVASGAALAGTWLMLGLVIADWLVRGRCVPGLPVVHRSLVIPGWLLVAPWWALLALEQVGPVPFAFGFGLAVLVVAGISAPSYVRRRLLVMVGAAYAVAAFGSAGRATGRPSVAGASTLRYAAAGAAATLFATVVAARHTDERRPWSLARSGPLALAAPAVLWVLTATGVLVAAHAETSHHGYLAWQAYTSTLVPPVLQSLGATAVGAAALALLGIGAAVSVRGLSSLRPPLAFVLNALVWTAVLAWAWTVPGP